MNCTVLDNPALILSQDSSGTCSGVGAVPYSVVLLTVREKLFSCVGKAMYWSDQCHGHFSVVQKGSPSSCMQETITKRVGNKILRTPKL